MKVSSLQRLDRFFGVPLCFGLTVLRKIFRRRTGIQHPIRRILFVKLAEQGSTVLAYSALRAATDWVGKENVYMACFNDNRFIVDALGVIPEKNVLPIAYRSAAQLAGSTLRTLLRLHKLEIDAVIDMEFFARGSAAFAFMTAAPMRVGFHAFFGAGPYRGDLFTHRLLYNPYLHTAQIFRMLVEVLHCDPAALPTLPMAAVPLETDLPQFQANPSELAEVQSLLERESGSREPPLVLLNPNGSDLIPLRRWDGSRYVELARRLLRKFPELHVAFTGSPQERETAEASARQVNDSRCFSLAGKTTLRQLLVLYGVSRVLVTNDSGPAHFAALTSIQVVTLFGPETPKLFGAPTPRNTSVWAGLACSPCVNAYNNRQTTCRNNLCMQKITTDQVFEEVCCAWQRAGNGRLEWLHD